MKILITGANGYIGSRLVAALAVQHDVVGLVRQVPGNQNVNLEFRVLGDICAVQASDLEGIECVIHTAGIADASGYASDLQRVNVDGSRALAKACLESDVRLFINLSSIKAAGEGSVGAGCPEKPISAYGQSKLAAEEAIDEILDDSQIEACHLRFPLVYGEGVENNFRMLVKLAQSRWPLPIGALTARRSYCSVDNLISLVREFIRSEQTSGVVYLADAEPISLPDIISAIGAQMGKKPQLVKFPAGLLKIGVKLLKPEYLNQLFTDSVVDISETRERFPGWEPVSTRECLSFLGNVRDGGR